MVKQQQVELYPGLIVTSADTVADIGCGGGHTCVLAGQAGAGVIAVDAVPATLDYVRSRMASVPARSFEAHLSTTSDIPVATGCASVIVCTEVLEHVPDPAVFMTELVRIGRPGAQYLISVPDARSEYALKEISPPEVWQAPNHVRIFERAGFRSLVEQAGLTVTRTDYVGFYWSIWWILRFGAGLEYTPGAPGDVPEVLRKWEETWTTLNAMPDSAASTRRLDHALPKSQLVVARKP